MSFECSNHDIISLNDIRDGTQIAFIAPFRFHTSKQLTIEIVTSKIEKDFDINNSAQDYQRLTKGSATFEQGKPENQLWTCEANADTRSRVNSFIADKKKGIENWSAEIQLLRWRIVAFSGGIYVSTFIVKASANWKHLSEHFPAQRDAISDIMRNAALSHLKSLSNDTSASFDFPYFHIVLAGKTDKAMKCESRLESGFRNLVYPENRNPIHSFSPHPEEFIFLGYAFSLILRNHDPLQRLQEICPLLEYTSYVYRKLALASDFCSRLVSDKHFRDVKSIKKEKQKMNMLVLDFISPTFSYTHEILVLREELLKTWRVDILIKKAQFLIDQLETHIDDRRKHKEEKFEKYITYIALIFTLLTAISVFYDGVMLLNALDIIQSLFTQAWYHIVP